MNHDKKVQLLNENNFVYEKICAATKKKPKRKKEEEISIIGSASSFKRKNNKEICAECCVKLSCV